MKAALIGQVNLGAKGFQQLWKLDPPFTEYQKMVDYVVTSEINCPIFGCECLVFESDSKGLITNWVNIGGGEYLSAEEALKQIGYSI